MGRKAGVAQGFGDIMNHVAATELGWRHVHRDHDLQRPGLGLGAGFAYDPVAQQDNKFRLLGQGDEAIRRQQAQARVSPAHQRFHRGNSYAIDLEARLIVQHKLIAANALQQLVLKRALFHQGGVHLRGEVAPGVLACTLGAVQGQVGVANQVTRRTRILSREHHAQADADLNRLALR
ncbi:hypothetical protein D3C77_433540 [compost metagenome]